MVKRLDFPMDGPQISNKMTSFPDLTTTAQLQAAFILHRRKKDLTLENKNAGEINDKFNLIC